MSDSDDTDILLLIPPDFFLIDSSDTESVNHNGNLVERTVVNDLISHVNELENRIADIERKDIPLSKFNDSSSSFNSTYSSNFPNSEMNPNTRQFGSSSSLNTSPSRRVNRFNSLPPTPSSSSYRSLVPSVSTSRIWGNHHLSPSKNSSRSSRNLFEPNWENGGREKIKENELLSEVDRFLDGLKRDSAASKEIKEKELVTGVLPPSPQKRNSADGVGRLELDEVDRLLKEVEAEQKNIEARLSSHDAPEVRRIVKKPGDDIGSVPDLGYGVRAHWNDVDRFLQSEKNERPQLLKQPVEEPVVTARNQYKLGDNVGSIPDLGYGLREAWASPVSVPKQSKPLLSSELSREQGVEAPIAAKAAVTLQSGVGAPPKQTPKVFASRRKLDLDSHTQDVGELDTITSLDSIPSSMDQVGAARYKRATVQPATSDSEKYLTEAPKTLPSLAELWSDGEQPAAKSAGDTKLLQKYEEEKCRRQHCEQLVQALQSKLLESQQKLAVALQVDCEKDAAISKLQGAWNSLADHWRSVEDQRHTLTKQLQDHKLKSESQLKQMQEKLERYETELSKALDLAHSFKEQSANMERTHATQLEQLVNKVQELEHRLAVATQACNNAMQKEEALCAQVNQDNAKLTQLQAAMDAAAKSLTTHEADIAILAEEKSALQTKLKEEKARLETHQHSRDKLRSELEDSRKMERKLQIELKKSSEQLEAVKTELHDFYQAQLERVVREKLKEFQSQLDAAESTLQRELESRERSVAQLAARQLQHVTEKHKLEVSLLEQKHSEELRLMQLQLAKASRQIQDLESRLASHEKRSSNLAERLHGVMENQWREALNIISNPNGSSSKAGDQAVKLGRQSEKINDTAWMLVQQQQQQQQQQQKSQSQCSSRSSTDEAPFSRDGQVTHRTATPVHQHMPGQAEESDELRRYIKMLLDRAPGNPVETTLDQQKVDIASRVSGATGNNNMQLKPPWK